MKFQRFQTLCAQGAVAGKRVFIRADLNVPQDADGRITEDTRVRASVPCIEMALKAGAAVMVTSHLGRPTEGAFQAIDSLAPVAERLSALLGQPVRLASDWIDGVSVAAGEVVLLENCRVNVGEKKNDTALAKKMAALCDVFVHDVSRVCVCGMGCVTVRVLPERLGGVNVHALRQQYQDGRIASNDERRPRSEATMAKETRERRKPHLRDRSDRDGMRHERNYFRVCALVGPAAPRQCQALLVAWRPGREPPMHSLSPSYLVIFLPRPRDNDVATRSCGRLRVVARTKCVTSSVAEVPVVWAVMRTLGWGIEKEASNLDRQTEQNCAICIGCAQTQLCWQ